MKQTVNKELIADTRFYINSETLDFLMKRPIYGYKIEEIYVGIIRRRLFGEVFSLYKTETYQYLLHPDDAQIKKNYQYYASIATVDKADRSENTYKDLISNFSVEDYDIKKGIIVINQYNFIEEGLHRCCILLKKYGEKHKIKVLRIEEQKCSKKIWIKNFIYDIKRLMHIDC